MTLYERLLAMEANMTDEEKRQEREFVMNDMIDYYLKDKPEAVRQDPVERAACRERILAEFKAIVLNR